jgi:hypothetical protein
MIHRIRDSQASQKIAITCGCDGWTIYRSDLQEIWF